MARVGQGMVSLKSRTRRAVPSMNQMIWSAFQRMVYVWNSTEGSKGTRNCGSKEYHKKVCKYVSKHANSGYTTITDTVWTLIRA